MPSTHQSHSVTPSLRKGETKYDESLRGWDKAGKKPHSPVTITRKTDLIQGSSVYFQSNQNRLVRKIKLNLKTTFQPPLPSSWPQLHSRILTFSSPNGAGGWGMGAAGSSPCYFHCPLPHQGTTCHTLPLLHLVVHPIGEGFPQPESFQ